MRYKEMNGNTKTVMQELQNISANFIMLNKKLKDLQTQVKEFYEQQPNTEPSA